jgi:hypothetical protein
MELSNHVQIRSGGRALIRRSKKACQTKNFYVIGSVGAELLEFALSSGHGLPLSKVQPT